MGDSSFPAWEKGSMLGRTDQMQLQSWPCAWSHQCGASRAMHLGLDPATSSSLPASVSLESLPACPLPGRVPIPPALPAQPSDTKVSQHQPPRLPWMAFPCSQGWLPLWPGEWQGCLASSSATALLLSSQAAACHPSLPPLSLLSLLQPCQASILTAQDCFPSGTGPPTLRQQGLCNTQAGGCPAAQLGSWLLLCPSGRAALHLGSSRTKEEGPWGCLCPAPCQLRQGSLTGICQALETSA